MMNSPVKIAVIESNALLRETLTEALGRDGQFEIVLSREGCQSREGAEEVYRSIEQSGPQVVLLDLGPFRPASEAPVFVATVTLLKSRPRVLAMSNARHPCFISTLMRNGAAGHVSKDRVTRRELLDAVATVASGTTYLCAHTKRTALLGLAGIALRQRLSPRELSVLAALARYGRTQTRRQIAAGIGIKMNTLNDYVEDLREKLSTRDEGELLERGRALGLVE